MTIEEKDSKEIATLQARILSLEETIAGLKKSSNDDSAAKIAALEKEKAELRKESEELKAKFWDGKERRAKDRRAAPRKERREAESDDDYIGGPYG